MLSRENDKLLVWGGENLESFYSGRTLEPGLLCAIGAQARDRRTKLAVTSTQSPVLTTRIRNQKSSPKKAAGTPTHGVRTPCAHLSLARKSGCPTLGPSASRGYQLRPSPVAGLIITIFLRVAEWDTLRPARIDPCT